MDYTPVPDIHQLHLRVTHDRTEVRLARHESITFPHVSLAFIILADAELVPLTLAVLTPIFGFSPACRPPTLPSVGS